MTEEKTTEPESKRSTKYRVNIGGKYKEEPKKNYFFRNIKMPGTNVTCFMGDAPKKGEWFKDTINQKTLVDGEVVSLTESEADHLRNRGIEKPIMSVDSDGYRKDTGKKYIDRRFDLYEA